jgi:outer membrane protein OmpA-like peptidoglycan-associated protein
MVAGTGHRGDLLFDFGSAALTTGGASVVRELALKMREDPALRVELRGHTDTRGTEAFNVELSARRARAAADMLEAEGVDRSRIEVHALGSTAPIDRGSSAAAFAKNRRVELHLTTTGRTP